jgi:phage shock protein A
VILEKFWSAFKAQINKIANIFWEADPVAQMRYEYDQAVAQLKEGRVGLEQYRGLVERVTRQVSANKGHVQKLEAETKAYLKAGDRATAAKFALELQKAKEELAANSQQLDMHETSYGNNLKKIQHANEKLIELRDKIQKYDAELKMSAAEAEIAKLAEGFNMNLTTDFGQNRTGDPAEDRPEPRQGARGGGLVQRRDRRHRGRRAHARRDGRAGAPELRS